MNRFTIGLIALIATIGLTGCQPALEVKQLHHQLAKQTTHIDNYHFKYRREDYDVTTNQVLEKTISNGALFNDQSGQGVRIDKKNEKYVNKVEVISNGKEAYYRSLSGDWQHSLEPTTVLKNMVSLNYDEVASFIAQRLKRLTFKTVEGKWVGNEVIKERQLANKVLSDLNQSIVGVEQLTIEVQIVPKTQTIEELHLKGYDRNNRLIAQMGYTFDEFNRQKKKSLPTPSTEK